MSKDDKPAIEAPQGGAPSLAPEVQEPAQCSICADDIQDPAKGRCQHAFCLGCLTRWVKLSSDCPLCRAEIDRIVHWPSGECPNKSRRRGTDEEISVLGAAGGVAGEWLAGIDGTRLLCVHRVEHKKQEEEGEEGSEEEEQREEGACLLCHSPSFEQLMLLCDGCDSPHHTFCVGLGEEVPEGNWFCAECRQGSQSSMPLYPAPCMARMDASVGKSEASLGGDAYVDASVEEEAVSGRLGSRSRSRRLLQLRNLRREFRLPRYAAERVGLTGGGRDVRRDRARERERRKEERECRGLSAAERAAREAVAQRWAAVNAANAAEEVERERRLGAAVARGTGLVAQAMAGQVARRARGAAKAGTSRVAAGNAMSSRLLNAAEWDPSAARRVRLSNARRRQAHRRITAHRRGGVRLQPRHHTTSCSSTSSSSTSSSSSSSRSFRPPSMQALAHKQELTGEPPAASLAFYLPRHEPSRRGGRPLPSHLRVAYKRDGILQLNAGPAPAPADDANGNDNAGGRARPRGKNSSSSSFYSSSFSSSSSLSHSPSPPHRPTAVISLARSPHAAASFFPFSPGSLPPPLSPASPSPCLLPRRPATGDGVQGGKEAEDEQWEEEFGWEEEEAALEAEEARVEDGKKRLAEEWRRGREAERQQITAQAVRRRRNKATGAGAQGARRGAEREGAKAEEKGKGTEGRAWVDVALEDMLSGRATNQWREERRREEQDKEDSARAKKEKAAERKRVISERNAARRRAEAAMAEAKEAAKAKAEARAIITAEAGQGEGDGRRGSEERRRKRRREEERGRKERKERKKRKEKRGERERRQGKEGRKGREGETAEEWERRRAARARHKADKWAAYMAHKQRKQHEKLSKLHENDQPPKE